MATPRTIEEESGTFIGTRHAHQGYHAGDFSNVPFHPPTSSLIERHRDNPVPAEGAWVVGL